jgi:DNA invertase Pin-like site-specific DNA recombinase
MAGKRASSKPDAHRVFGQGSGRKKTPCRADLYARVSTYDQPTLSLQNRAMRNGVSKAEIARRLQIGRTSVRRILKSKRV